MLFRSPAKLIIDLRDNQGGVFEKALDVADYFLNSGEVIVKTKSRDGSMKEYKAKGSAWSPETAIFILTSGETASSAEVLTAALKENRKAVIVGGKTRGKWTVEMLETLPNKFAIKYSVKQMQSPSGKSYQAQGITPDFNIGERVDTESVDLPSLQNSKLRLEKDPVLKAAYELK